MMQGVHLDIQVPMTRLRLPKSEIAVTMTLESNMKLMTLITVMIIMLTLPTVIMRSLMIGYDCIIVKRRQNENK